MTPEGVGKGGDINITTKSLSVTNGAQLNVLTRGQGNAGNITINATDTASFDGANIYGGASGILSSVDQTGVGNGGEINITTGSLAVTNGAQINALTLNKEAVGNVNAGNVNIDARDMVSFDGVNPNGGVSGVFTSVAQKVAGKGGDINITTKSLSLTGGAELITLTSGKGNAGNVNINVQDTVSFDGADNNNNYNASGILASVRPGGVGKGGDINITTGKLSMTNGATLSTTSEGSGAAGNIEINANSIRLDSGTLRSDTIAGQGNITLRSQNLILRRNSNITTNAQGNNVIGGNININTDVLAAFENSDISANSLDFRGGNVIINTKGIFGTQLRNASTLGSDITATGANPELNGTVQINTLDIDPSKGLVPLPVDVVDVARLVDQNVCTRGYGSSFTITGRGGLPPSPNTTLNNDAVWEDWRLTSVPVTSKPTEEQRSREETGRHPSTKKSAAEIVEAQGWIVNAQGEVILVAYAPTATLNRLGSLPSGCHLPVAK